MGTEQLTRVRPASPTGVSGLWAAVDSGKDVVPEASDGGGQKGRVPPAVRKITAKYGAVDLATANANLAARMKGTMPKIAGGLDGAGTVNTEYVKRAGIAAPNMVADDQPGDAPGLDQGMPVAPPTVKSMVDGYVKQAANALAGGPSDTKALLLALLEQMAPRMIQISKHREAPAEELLDESDVSGISAPTVKPAESTAELTQALMRKLADVAPQPTARGTPAVPAYVAQRKPIGFTVAGGTYTVPGIDVLASKVGLVILLPLDPTSATFVPSLGAEVTVACDGKEWDCFFPGVNANVVQLGMQILTFVYQNDQQQ